MWCVGESLKISFLNFFEAVVYIQAIVAEYVNMLNDMTHWCRTFSWALNDWELESIGVFLLLFSHLILV